MRKVIENKTVEEILNRQTIRIYKPEQITDEELDTLIACAIKAPSGRNSQPCTVRFVQNAEMLREMNIDFKDKIGWDTPAYTRWDTDPFYHDSPTFAVIFAEGSSFMDAGLMTENICVAAKAIGLGTCIVASVAPLFEGETGSKWKKALNIPEEWTFLIGICIGYPDEKPEFKPRDESKFTVIK
ncbi:MAG: nitroreductase family protein [Clostridia bacterium]|nr:nitroreductase family protein [Clostridia bacterium]MBQ4244932.1 nitroreductase family protein [Clostridia bacterium]